MDRFHDNDIKKKQLGKLINPTKAQFECFVQSVTCKNEDRSRSDLSQRTIPVMKRRDSKEVKLKTPKCMHERVESLTTDYQGRNPKKTNSTSDL